MAERHLPNLHSRLALVAMAALACLLIFMTLGVGGQWEFALPLRARKAATLFLVAYAIGMSTVLFQTATENRILTPAIMGFDSLYILLQSCIAFFIGSWISLALDARWMFLFQTLLMVAASWLLYWLLFAKGMRSLHQLVLAGVVAGVLFRSLSSFIQRMINPSEYAYLQDRFFASFNNPDLNLLAMATLGVVAATLPALRSLRTFDVLTLGRDIAVNLGVNHRRAVSQILVISAVLVSVSTALVGPVTFFGLLIAHLAYLVFPSSGHRYLLPAATLIGFIALAGGQLLLEQMLSFNTNLRVVVEFLGGLTFILILVRGKAR